jgi:hypothetical protein
MYTLITKFAIDLTVTMAALFTIAAKFTLFILSTIFPWLSKLPTFLHCSGYPNVLDRGRLLDI